MADQPEDSKNPADEPTGPFGKGGTEPETATLRFDHAERTGGTIGPYKLLDELGAGGMGTVYLAEQERPVRRRVALKVIKPGLDTAQVIARFEAERQALALMDHPNIAHVLDAGTTDSGRPYFVMDLVQGAPITRYCDAHRVPLRERLELFLPVCRAIQHAHVKGIIHRDLKPSNILITLRDEKPVAKIIDFGIAKATTQRLTERTLYTQHGQLVGTPDYMSPEQAGLGGLDVDTRSDVYSLGAVLYELLCGDTPLGHSRLVQLDYVSMLNVIYEEDPPTPSRRVTELGERGADLARRRDVELQRLSQSLRGELDWIVTKALEKERTRRYESASDLAEDIERHLANQPVEAGPPSKVYRLRKFARRNRAALAAAALIVLALVGGIIVSTWQAYRATVAERDMAIERRAAIDAQGEADAARRLAVDQGKQLAVALAQAEDAASSERAARDEIERRLRVADAMRLAMQSRDAGGQYPQRALLLAAEAVEATRRHGEPVIPAAHQALRDALEGIGGRPLYKEPADVRFLQTLPDGQHLITGGSGIRLWSLAGDDPAASEIAVGPPGLAQRAQAVSPDGRWLATLDGDNLTQLYVWDLQSRGHDAPAHTFAVSPFASVNQVVFSADSRWIAATTLERAWLWDLANEAQTPRRVEITPEDGRLGTLVVSADNRWAITYESGRSLNLWPLGNSDENAPDAQVLVSDSQGLERIALSRDRRWLAATGSYPRPWSRLWDLAEADPFQSPQDFAGPIIGSLSRLVFAPDGRTLVATRRDEIWLWDLSTEDGPTSPVSLIARQGIGAVDLDAVTFGGVDRTRSVIAITDDGTILYWDLTARDPQASRVVVGRHPGRATVRLAVSPSGRWLVSMRRGDIPRLWDLSGTNVNAIGLPLPGHDGGIERVAFGGRAPGFFEAGERWLMTAGANAPPRLWDLAAEDPSALALGSQGFDVDGRNVAIRPDGGWVIATKTGVKLLQPDGLPHGAWTAVEFLSPLATNRMLPGDVPLSRDGKWLATRVQDSVSVWEVSTDRISAARARKADKTALRRLWKLQLGDAPPEAAAPYALFTAAPSQSVTQAAISPDGRWVCIEYDESRIQLRHIGAGESQSPPIDLGESERFPVFSPDGRSLIAFGQPRGRPIRRLWNLQLDEPHEMYLWDLHADPPQHVTIDLQHPLSRADGVVAYSTDGRWLAACVGREVRLWELGAVGPIGEPQALSGDDEENVAYEHVVVGRDGRWVAAAASSVQGGDVVHVWNRSGENVGVTHHELRGHDFPIHVLALDPQNEWLATASSDGRVQLWSLTAAQPEEASIALSLGDSSGAMVTVSRLLFSADGNWLAAATGDSIRFWPLDLEELLGDAFRLAARELDAGEMERYRLDAHAVLRGGLLRRATELSRQIDQNPQDAESLSDRIDLLACAGQFDDALGDLDRLIRLRPDDHWPQYRRLSLLAQTGKKAAFRKACDEMAERFRSAPDESLEILERIAKGSLFWGDSGADWAAATRRADDAVARAEASNHWILPWAQVAKGLAEYRRGNHADALAWAEKGLASRSQGDYYALAATGNLVRALALAKLDRLEDANRAVDEAKSIHNGMPHPVEGLTTDWHDWYMTDILLRETEGVLAAKSPPEAATALPPG